MQVWDSRIVIIVQSILVHQKRSSSVICLEVSQDFAGDRQGLLDDISVFNHCCKLLEIQFPIPRRSACSSLLDNVNLTRPYQLP
jgi:hypothetical protein